MNITVQKISEDEAKAMGTDSWSPWSSQPCEFDWEYSSTEKAYVLSGKARVTDENGDNVEFGSGDLVTFPSGTRCHWQVIEAISKVYTFE